MEPDPKSAITKRRYERIALVNCPAEVYRLRSLSILNSRTNIGRRLINLSEVGVQVAVSERLAPDTRIRVVAKIPSFADTIEGEFSVRWCATNMHVPGEFFAGAEFTSMPSGQVAKIQQLRKVFRSAQFRQKLTTKVREKREGGGFRFIDNPRP